MSITGMMKVLKTNYLIDLSPTITCSSNDDDKSKFFDLDEDSQWVSVGSDDTTTETIEIDFTVATDIDRIHLKHLQMFFSENGLYASAGKIRKYKKRQSWSI